MGALTDLRTAIAAVKTTGSGLVEWASNLFSLPNVHDKTVTCFVQLGIANCANVGAMQALGPDDAKLAFVVDGGIYYWNATDVNSTGRASVVSGFWIPDKHITMTALVTGIASANDVPVNDGAGHVTWGTLTVSSIGWGNITAKPIITGTTNPAIAGNLAVGGTFAVTGNAGVGGTLAAGNTTITGTLSASGATTTAGISNTGNVATGTLSSTGNGTIGGILNVNAAGTSIINGNLTVNTALTVGDDIFALGDLFMTGAICPGVCTTGTRPTAAPNTYPVMFNTTTGKHEGWNGSTWNAFY